MVPENDGPEDHEIDRLRAQLAAAERLAELRAQAERVRNSIERIDTEIEKSQPAPPPDSSAANNRPASKANRAKSDEEFQKRQNEQKEKERSAITSEGWRNSGLKQKLWIVFGLLVIAGGVAAAALTGQSNGAASVQAGQNNDGTNSNSVAASETNKPALKLDCDNEINDSRAITVTPNVEWSWSKSAGFGAIAVAFDDVDWETLTDKEKEKREKTAVTAATTVGTKAAIQKVFTHTYSIPALKAADYKKKYFIYATLIDGSQQNATANCEFVVRYKARKSSPVVSPTVPASTRRILGDRYRYMESSADVRVLQNKINDVLDTSMSVDGVYGPGTRRQHLRALNRLGLSTSRVPAVPAAAAPRATTTTVPRATKTTLPPTPQYKLWEFAGGKNVRWDPCQGSIRIGINPNNLLTVPQLNLWDDFFRIEAALLSRLTGLSVVYVGHNNYIPTTSWVDRKTVPADISFFFGPPGSSSLLTADRTSNFSGSTWNFDRDVTTDPSFYPLNNWFFHVDSDSFGRKNDSRYFKHDLLRAMGLASLDNGPKTEIMTWNADGVGSYGDPQYGPGDKIGLGLVGASNGCF
jgi:hypothetical protein